MNAAYRMIVSKLPSGNLNHSALIHMDVAKSVSDQLNIDYGFGTHIIATDKESALMKSGAMTGPVKLNLSGQKNEKNKSDMNEDAQYKPRSPRI